MEAAVHAARDDFDQLVHSERTPGAVNAKLLEVVLDAAVLRRQRRLRTQRGVKSAVRARSGDVGPRDAHAKACWADSETLGGSTILAL